MRNALATLLVALAVGLAAFLVESWSLPDLEVRTIPWQTPAGGARAAALPGEVFVCERDGLDRIDLAVTPLDPAGLSDLELVLRDGGPDGEVLRRARGSSFEPFQWGGWLSFDFEPVPDTAGRHLHLALSPPGDAPATHVSPYVRYRGLAGHGRWSNEGRLSGPVLEGELLSQQPDLRALAFFAPRHEGAISLTLLDAQGEHELRRSTFDSPAPVAWGWIFLAFEPIAESRWREYSFRLDLPAESELQASEDGLCFFPFHGSGAVDDRLGGMTLGASSFADRDLIFRAWSRSGPSTAFGLLRERLGGRLLPLILAWLVASVLLAHALPRRRG